MFSLVTSNKPFSTWGEIFGDDIAATAMIDQLIHHSEILSLKSDSCRLRGKDLDASTLGSDPEPSVMSGPLAGSCVQGTRRRGRRPASLRARQSPIGDQDRGGENALFEQRGEHLRRRGARAQSARSGARALEPADCRDDPLKRGDERQDRRASRRTQAHRRGPCAARRGLATKSTSCWRPV